MFDAQKLLDRSLSRQRQGIVMRSGKGRIMKASSDLSSNPRR
jgi:hypothetical protein